MQFRVYLPEGIAGGQIASVNAGGAMVNVRIPKHAKAGDAILFELSQEELTAALGSSSNNNSSSSSNSNSNNAIFNGRVEDLEKIRQSVVKELTLKAAQAQALATTTTTKQKRLFECSDIFLSFCFGLLIGFSILFGFALGILYVTDPIIRQPRGPVTYYEEVVLSPGRKTKIIQTPDIVREN
jgi:hypothetical protein